MLATQQRLQVLLSSLEQVKHNTKDYLAMLEEIQELIQ
jgi:hypothetical protein